MEMPDGAEAGTGSSEAEVTGTAQRQAAVTSPEVARGARRKGRRLSREIVVIVIAALLLTLLVKAFAVQVYEIPSTSMNNTLLPGDRVLVNKLVYHFRDIHRGDIIVFSGAGTWGNLSGQPIPPPPSNPVEHFFIAALADVGIDNDNTYYIKRVIGLPGDHVACCTNGLLTVNGVPLHETSFLLPGAPASRGSFSITVPPGRLWVMGDNREFSDDSYLHDLDGFPDHGTIPENEVSGRAFFVIWPPSRFGDLPIPATFQQAALNTAPAGAAAALGAPLLLWRRHRKSRRPR
jgi:signal peptidase I